MREIKYRAWDKKLKGMFPVEELHFEDGKICGVICRVMGSLIDCIDSCENNPILVQFTGLKDKNGQEIYEGDIVDAGDWWKDNYQANVSSIAKVVFENGAFIIESIDNDDEGNYQEPAFEIDRSHLKIIGNIYGNTELLEKKQGVKE